MHLKFYVHIAVSYLHRQYLILCAHISMLFRCIYIYLEVGYKLKAYVFARELSFLCRTVHCNIDIVLWLYEAISRVLLDI